MDERTIEQHHRKLVAILDVYGQVKMERDRESQRQGGIPAYQAGIRTQAIRALIGEIQDRAYVLGQLHAAGIFRDGWDEVSVGELEDRLGITTDSRGGKIFPGPMAMEQVLPGLTEQLRTELRDAGVPNPERYRVAITKVEDRRRADQDLARHLAPDPDGWVE